MAPPSEQDEQPLGSAPEQRYRRPGRRALTALELVFSAEWVTASLVRQRVEAWLQELRWPPAQIEELVLAVSEAVSNSVEHGYRVMPDAVDHSAAVEVRGRVVQEPDGFRRAELTVRDHGGWREPVPGVSNRGHGMLIMRACVDRFSLDHSAAGTTVVLLGRPVPPLP